MLFASSEDAKERKVICDNCQSKKMLMCSECGCIIEAKIRWSYSYCPIGKWGRVEAKSDEAWDFKENI